MTISKAKSKNKSNRTKGDLFEILVAINLSKKCGLRIDQLIHDSEKVIQTINKFKDGKIRIKEQEDRAILALSHILKRIKDIKFAKNEKPIKVDWVGRGWQKKNSLSDIDLIFSKDNSIGISLKSTRSGKGTQKNIGAGKLKLYFGLDVSKEVEKMWSEIRAELKSSGGKLSELSETSNSKIKDSKYRFTIIQKIGEKFGREVQISATKKSIKLFNELNIERKSEFLEFIFGSKEKRPLLNVLVEGNKVTTNWNDGFNYFVSNKDIKAVEDKKEGGKGYYLYWW